jgi:hypothetical protein
VSLLAVGEVVGGWARMKRRRRRTRTGVPAQRASTLVVWPLCQHVRAASMGARRGLLETGALVRLPWQGRHEPTGVVFGVDAPTRRLCARILGFAAFTKRAQRSLLRQQPSANLGLPLRVMARENGESSRSSRLAEKRNRLNIATFTWQLWNVTTRHLQSRVEVQVQQRASRHVRVGLELAGITSRYI